MTVRMKSPLLAADLHVAVLGSRSGAFAVATRAALTLFALALSVAPMAAQIVAPAGRTLFNEGLLVRSLLRYDTFDEAASGQEIDRLRNVWAVVWGARPRLSLSVVTPLVGLRETGPAGDRRRTGTADSTLFARYDAWRKLVPGGFTRFSPEVGVKIPTGGTFGTGSTDLLAGLILSHIRDANWWIADVQWTFFGEGDNNLEQGNRWRADLAYLRRLIPKEKPGVPMLLLVAELNYETAERSQRNGGIIADSGGRVLTFSPGIEWIVSRRLILEAAVPIALGADLRGDQPEPNASLILGARWLF